MKITIAGGGPGGLYFALLMKLRHPDYEVTVFERNDAGSADGYGLVFWDDLLGQLYENDPVSASAVEDTMFSWVHQMIELDGERLLDEESSGYSIHRQQLLALLAERAIGLGVRIEYSREITSLEDLGDADLIVASDGVNSRLRSSLAKRFGTQIDVGRNKYVWLATDQVFDTFEFDFVNTDAGWIWSAAYSIDKSMSTFVVECPPETWTGLRLNELPAAESRATLEHVFADQLSGGHLSGQLRGRDTLLWLNFRTLVNRWWHAGEVVLLGDATHTTHFSIGSGTRLAIEDAISLANHLDRSNDQQLAFSSYEAERKAALRRPQAEARFSSRWHEEIGRYASLSAKEFRSLWILRRSPLLPHVNPRLYYRLHKASSSVPVIRKARDQLGLRARGVPGRHALSEPPMALNGDRSR